MTAVSQRSGWRLSRVVLVIASLMFMFCASQSTVAQECTGRGAVGYLCSVPHAEDLVAVPGTNWIVTSGTKASDRDGALYLIDRAKKSGSLLFGRNPVVAEYDASTYPGCPGPVDLRTFSASGINLREGANGIHTLYVMNHQLRIEAFALDATKARPTLTWKGCITFPTGARGNSVSPLPDGGLAATFMASPDYFDGPGTVVDDKAYIDRYRIGEITGHAAIWTAADGWKKVPGTEGSGPNGIEASADGRWLYIANWPSGILVRAPLFEGGVRAIVALGILPDNVRWGDDGMLYAGGGLASRNAYFACWGTPGCKNDFGVARIDPQTMAVSLVPHPDTRPEFANVTGVVVVSGELWLTGFIDDRVAYMPLPPAAGEDPPMESRPAQ